MKFLRVKENRSKKSKSDFHRHLTSVKLRVYMQLILADFFLLLLSVWLSFWFRLAQPYNHSFTEALVWILCSVCVSGIPIYALTGQYRDLTRYMDSRYIYQLSVRNGILVMFLVMLAIFMNLPMPPRSTWLLLWLLSTVLIGSSRFVFRDFYNYHYQ